MKSAWPLVLIFLLPGCWSGSGGYGGGDQLQSFEVDNDCNVVSTLTLSGSSTTWNGCRLRYDAFANVYTWQFTTPGTTGTWTSQGPGWFTLSLNLNSPQNRTLSLSNVVAEEPPFVKLDEVVFAYAPSAGAIVGGNGSIEVGANIIYPGGDGSAIVAQLAIDAVGFGSFAGSISGTIGDTPTLTTDAAVLPACDDDGGCVP